MVWAVGLTGACIELLVYRTGVSFGKHQEKYRNRRDSWCLSNFDIKYKRMLVANNEKIIAKMIHRLMNGLLSSESDDCKDSRYIRVFARMMKTEIRFQL